MTTTDTDALTEQLWEAIAEVRDQHPRVFNDAPTDDVVAAVLPIIRAQQAEAWREGFDAGERDVWEHEHGSYDNACIPNPYKSEESTR